MISVRQPLYKGFDSNACETLYNKLKNQIGDDDFNDVIKRTRFYSFYITSTWELIGCIYYYYKNNRLYVNAFAERNHHLLNLECFKESLKWFKEDVYAETTHKTATLCLLKCGFKKINKNTFVYRRK